MKDLFVPQDLKNKMKEFFVTLLLEYKNMSGKDITNIMNNTDIVYDIKTYRTNGMARYRRMQHGGKRYTIRVNPAKYRFDPEKYLKVTFTHEVVHLINYEYPETGKGHDFRFKNLLIRLGGTGQRCSNYGFTADTYDTLFNSYYGTSSKRSKTVYDAIYDDGHIITISAKRYNLIMGNTKNKRGIYSKKEYISKYNGKKYWLDFQTKYVKREV